MGREPRSRKSDIISGLTGLLIFVERYDHIPSALALAKTRKDAQLLALSPAVMAALDEAGVAYVVPESYVDRDSLYRLGYGNYERVERLGDWLEDKLPLLPERLRLNVFRLYFYQIKIHLDTLSLRVQEISAVLSSERPKGVAVFAHADPSIWAEAGGIHFMTFDGPIYAALAPLVAAGFATPIETAPTSAASGTSDESRRVSTFKTGARLLKHALQLLPSAFAAAAGRPSLWQWGELTHDVPAVAALLDDEFATWRWGNALAGPLGGLIDAALGESLTPEETAALEKFWNSVEAELGGQSSFKCGELSFFPLIKPVLRRLLTRDLPRAARFHGALRRLIRTAKPRAAFGVSTPHPGNNLAAWALRAEGVPVIYMQEGGLYGYCDHPIHHYCELSWGDRFLSYGPGCADHLNSHRPTPRQRVEAVVAGSLRLRRLPRPAPGPRTSKDRVVMYIVSDFFHNLRLAPMGYGDRDYFSLRRRLVKALLATNARIIYKGIPGGLQRDALKPLLDRHPDRIEITDSPLSSVLERADSFLLDWPTTTLLEILATEKPVDVLLDRSAARPIESALPLLRRRARVFLDADSLESALRKPEGPRDEDLTDRSFLEAYGTAGAAAWNDEQFVEFFRGLAPDRGPR
jgi:hypothetical protein